MVSFQYINKKLVQKWIKKIRSKGYKKSATCYTYPEITSYAPPKTPFTYTLDMIESEWQFVKNVRKQGRFILTLTLDDQGGEQFPVIDLCYIPANYAHVLGPVHSYSAMCDFKVVDITEKQFKDLASFEQHLRKIAEITQEFKTTNAAIKRLQGEDYET